MLRAMRLAIRNSRPNRAEDRLLVAGGRRGSHNAARTVPPRRSLVCFFAPPTFVAFHRRTPVPVECRCLLVHEKAVRELVSEDGALALSIATPVSGRSSVDTDDLTCVADQHLRQGRPRRGRRCKIEHACQGRSPAPTAARHQVVVSWRNEQRNHPEGCTSLRTTARVAGDAVDAIDLPPPENAAT